MMMNLEHYPKIQVFPKNQKFPKNWAEVPLAQGQFGISFHILKLKFQKKIKILNTTQKFSKILDLSHKS